MKRIGIEINGVLRDTIEKFKQIYEKHLVDSTEFESIGKKYELTFSGESDEVVEINENATVNCFKYEILSPTTSLTLMNHFAFPSKDELYNFMYEEYTMELFGHAPSSELNTFIMLNEMYYNLRDEYELLIVSDEIGKSKPASLFFLSKFGCLLEKVVFYSEITKEHMWDQVDVLITSNPDLIKNKPDDKIVVKFVRDYNKNIECELEISTLFDFNLLLKKITKEYV
jgi:hypothetical protein